MTGPRTFRKAHGKSHTRTGVHSCERLETLDLFATARPRDLVEDNWVRAGHGERWLEERELRQKLVEERRLFRELNFNIEE